MANLDRLTLDAYSAKPADFRARPAGAFTSRKSGAGYRTSRQRRYHCVDRLRQRTEKATFYGTIVGDQEVWATADRIAAWLHETALRLFPESPYAKEHGG